MAQEETHAVPVILVKGMNEQTTEGTLLDVFQVCPHGRGAPPTRPRSPTHTPWDPTHPDALW